MGGRQGKIAASSRRSLCQKSWRPHGRAGGDAKRNDSAACRSKRFSGNFTEDIMTASTAALASLSAAARQRQLRRAVIASTVSTTIAWYDFFLYSTVTGLVFAKLYFPNSDPLVWTLQAFAIHP